MARERNPERDKARRIWLDSGGTLTARQVAEQVGVKPEQVRKWKSLDTIGSRSLTKADLSEIGERIKYWMNEVSRLENIEARGGRNRVFRVVPRDL